MGVISVFHRYYHPPTLANSSLEDFRQGKDLFGGNKSEVAAGLALNALPESFIQCTRERPVLCLLLMLGTLWMGYTLYQFKRRYCAALQHSQDKSLEKLKLRLGGMYCRMYTAELALDSVSSDRIWRNFHNWFLKSYPFCQSLCSCL